MLLDADSGLMFDARNAAHSGSHWPTGMAAPIQIQQPPAVRATVAAYLDHAPVEEMSATLAPQ